MCERMCWSYCVPSYWRCSVENERLLVGCNYGQDTVSHVDDDANPCRGKAEPSKGMRSKTNAIFESGLKIGLDTKEN